MELKKYIENTARLITPIIDHIQLQEYKNKELDFAYGLEEAHSSFRRLGKQIIRIIFR
tara:strand:+ start:9677 stop:9850 length:174 start_codon:yes stop_codon:yes gene_type:complete